MSSPYLPSVLHRLFHWADETPEAPAQMYKAGGAWKPLTTREFADRVYHLALYLESRGFTPNDVAAILAYNSPEWVHTDLAVQLLGAKSAGLYPNSSGKDIQYILNHTQASVIAVQNRDYFKKMVGENNETPIPDWVKLVLVFDGDTSVSPKAVAYADAIKQGKALAAKQASSDSKGKKHLQELLNRIDPKAGAIMIYTSGTTGNPKGALLSHDNLVFTSDSVSKYWKLPYGKGTMFSFLPLCHVAEKLQTVGVGISQRYLVYYCSKFENVSGELVEVQPTLLLCVPRLWEKMMEGVQNKVNRGTGVKKKLAVWALGLGARVSAAKYERKLPNPLDLVQLKVAEKVVIEKVRTALGLSKAELLASGAASLSPHVAKWFRCLGLEILEDFGQTESTGVICMTEPGVESAGTVGKPLPGMEFKIAEDGEIMTRGRHVFVGYYKDAENTAKTITPDGWLLTGDLGEVNSQGLVRIRGRKKEVMKTSGGKMIAPLPIEERLKASEIISQVCIVGDGRKYLSALITLSESTLADLQKKRGTSKDVVLSDPEITAKVKKEIDKLNQSLASFEQIKRFTVLSREFSIADDEMTPTMKMKRNVVEKSFQKVIDQMYSGAGAGDA